MDAERSKAPTAAATIWTVAMVIILRDLAVALHRRSSFCVHKMGKNVVSYICLE